MATLTDISLVTPKLRKTIEKYHEWFRSPSPWFDVIKMENSKVTASVFRKKAAKKVKSASKSVSKSKKPVKKAKPTQSVSKRTIRTKPAKFEYWYDPERGNKWFWVLKASNGHVVARSWGFDSEKELISYVNALKKHTGRAKVSQRT